MHERDGIDAEYMCYPRYDSPTGKIVGLPYLGKSYISDQMIEEAIIRVKSKYSTFNGRLGYISKVMDELRLLFHRRFINNLKTEMGIGWFKGGADSVDPRVASLYYAADRLAHQPEIEYLINQGCNVVIDRYAYSNSAHQGGKKTTPEERNEVYEWNARLEFELLGLLPADLKLFLHMPTEYANLIKLNRPEKLDEHEKNPEHLYHAERAYLELVKKYEFDTIECIKKTQEEPVISDIKSKLEISEEVYDIVKRNLTLR